MSRAPGRRSGTSRGDLTRLAPVRRALAWPSLQFWAVLPTLALVLVVLISAAAGLEHPGANFGTVFTWVVWWGSLLVSFLLLGRAWCLVCPIGAVPEWLQRLSPWSGSRYTAGLNLRWPGRLRGLWLPTALFVVFVFLDNGYGMSNSPRMTAGLIAVIFLGAAWTSLVFERRAFCRHLCPLTAFIGISALASTLELRRRDPDQCRSGCQTKDCYRGSEAHHGCPVGEFPGGGLDSNLHCILCTECVRSCPGDNIAIRLRPPGRDLWAMTRSRLDTGCAAAVVVGLATVVPLLTVALLPPLRGLLGRWLPAGIPPNDPPRLAAVALLLGVGLGVTLALVCGFSWLSRWASGNRVTTRALFTRLAGALIPIGLAKLMADLLDHALRTWGALPAVTRALWLDFPWNRVLPDRVSTVHLLDPAAVYGLQVVLLLGGLVWGLYAMHRICRSVLADHAAGFASFLPAAGLALLLTLASLWTLGTGLL